MREIHFIKMRGLDNDFVVIDNRARKIELDIKDKRMIADRRKGIGCDQILIINQKSGVDEIEMQIFNADGSEAEACGNGARCVASYLMDDLGTAEVKIKTVAGKLKAYRESSGLVKVNMGKPSFDWKKIPLAMDCDTLAVPLNIQFLDDPVCISMGNPHAVFIVEDADLVNIEAIGPEVEQHPIFPNKTNVEFVSIEKEDTIRMRVWERGVGITPACGSGACAAAIAANLRGIVGSTVKVRLDSGELCIVWPNKKEVFMIGPVMTTFSGVLT